MEHSKVSELLDHLERCGPDAFNGLVKALEDTKQEHAARILKQPSESRASHSNILFQICSYPDYSFNDHCTHC